MTADPQDSPRHAVVVGGSGMLRGVCLELAARGHQVTVIGRRPNRLQSLVDEASGAPGAIHPLALDYRDAPELARSLLERQRLLGPIDLAVCWIHGTAPEAPLAVAEALDRQGILARYFRVLGSASREPAELVPKESRERLVRLRRVAYREVLLGFARERGRSRWLTDTEICEGVLAAVDGDVLRYVVGTIRPWALRPG